MSVNFFEASFLEQILETPFYGELETKMQQSKI